jgi:hypothetical protein
MVASKDDCESRETSCANNATPSDCLDPKTTRQSPQWIQKVNIPQKCCSSTPAQTVSSGNAIVHHLNAHIITLLTPETTILNHVASYVKDMLSREYSNAFFQD